MMLQPTCVFQERKTRSRKFQSGLLAVAVAVSSCGGGSSESVDGPLLRHRAPLGDGSGLQAEIQGILEVQGGCLFVVSPESGVRYPVVWPALTTWSPATQTVQLANGEGLSVGDNVSGGGGYFKVDEIEQYVGGDAAAAAREYLDNPDGEVAVANNSIAAIGRSS